MNPVAVEVLQICLVLASLYAGPIVAVVALALALAIGERRRDVVLLAVAGAVLCGVWIVLSSLAGIRADETGTSSSIFSEVAWEIASVTAGTTSVVLGVRRHRRRHPDPVKG